jgi:hypothetical protein
MIYSRINLRQTNYTELDNYKILTNPDIIEDAGNVSLDRKDYYLLSVMFFIYKKSLN